MMRVVLDGRELATGVTTLRDAVRLGIEATSSSGRMIVQVLRDGAPIPPEMLDSGNIETGEGTIEFLSALPAEMVRSVLVQCAEALEATEQTQQEACELIQSGDTGGGLALLQTALETWQSVRDALDKSGQLLGCDLASIELPGIDEDAGFAASMRSLVSALRDLKDANDREDWSALSDIAGYDLDACSKHWRRLLAELAVAIPNRTASTGEVRA